MLWQEPGVREREVKKDSVVGWSDGLCEIWQKSLVSMALEWALLFVWSGGPSGEQFMKNARGPIEPVFRVAFLVNSTLLSTCRVLFSVHHTFGIKC